LEAELLTSRFFFRKLETATAGLTAARELESAANLLLLVTGPPALVCDTPLRGRCGLCRLGNAIRP